MDKKEYPRSSIHGRSHNIISTQKYVRANLDELKEQLVKFHPLNET